MVACLMFGTSFTEAAVEREHFELAKLLDTHMISIDSQTWQNFGSFVVPLSLVGYYIWLTKS